ncbi:LysR family transcriptional regulator [Acinetobacter haemolyticus]|nr:LysR family transcriptional regulator [Acinetobacter haemolyticus]
MQKLSCQQLATDPLWKQLVYARIKEVKSIQRVADEIGYARASLSLALRDKYIGSTKKLENRVLDVLGQVHCPFLKKSISPAECGAFETREAPTQNPSEMRHWRACKSCDVGYNTRVKSDS